MISFTTQSNIFTDLSQNTTASNVIRGAYLMNIEHRYLLQKYFANEGSFSIQTVGASQVSMTSGLGLGAINALLISAWNYQTSVIPVTFVDGENRNILFTNGSTTIQWDVPIVGNQIALTTSPASGATSATLNSPWTFNTTTQQIQFGSGETKTTTLTKGSSAISWTGGLNQAESAYFFTSIIGATFGTGYQVLSIGGVQFYPFPPNYSKLKDVTITVGNLKWTLDEIRTREEWDKLNVFPYYADIPKNFFIFPGGDRAGQIGIWPIPSTTGNIITYNYKFRVPDLSIADYITGTLSVNQGSTAVTGAGTSWTVTTNPQLESRWIQIPQPTGDNLWYQVASVNSTSSITLYQPYQGINVSGGSYTLGQMPLIAEDFQDMLYLKALMTYYNSIVLDKGKYDGFKEDYDKKLSLLNEYSGSNTVQVNLSRRYQQRNPNVYPYGNLG